MMQVILQKNIEAHRFHAVDAPHPLAVKSAKAPINGAMLIPHADVLGHTETVWGVRTSNAGSVQILDGDWIVQHPALGVFVMTDSEFQGTFVR